MSTPRFRRCTYHTVPGRSGWPSRDPLGELGFKLLHTASSVPQVGQNIFLPLDEPFVSDSMEDQNGVSLYGFIGENPVNQIDVLGLKVCKIMIYAGHNVIQDNKTGTVITGGGLEGFYQTEVAHGIEKRKCSDRIGFVGCGMNGLNGISNQQGFGIPGMPPSRYPFLPSSYDLEWAPYLSSDIGKALKAAETQANNMCNSSDCCCSQINIGITFTDDGSAKWAKKYLHYSKVVRCNKQP